MRTAERQHSCSAAKIDHLPVRATTGHSSLCTGTVTCGTLPHAGQRASAERSRSGACSRTQRNHAMTLRQLRPSCSLACGPGVASSSTPTARRGKSLQNNFAFALAQPWCVAAPPRSATPSYLPRGRAHSDASHLPLARRPPTHARPKDKGERAQAG